MHTAYFFSFTDPNGILLEVMISSSSCPACYAGIFPMPNPFLPPRSGKTYQEAHDALLNNCKAYPFPGALGEAIRLMGQTGQRQTIQRVWKSNRIPGGFQAPQMVVDNRNAVIGEQLFVSGTVNIGGPR